MAEWLLRAQKGQQQNKAMLLLMPPLKQRCGVDSSAPALLAPLLHQAASATPGNSLSTAVPFAYPAVMGQSKNWDMP